MSRLGFSNRMETDTTFKTHYTYFPELAPKQKLKTSLREFASSPLRGVKDWLRSLRRGSK